MAASSTGWYFTSEFSTLCSHLTGFHSFSVLSTDFVREKIKTSMKTLFFAFPFSLPNMLKLFCL